ncbi:acyl-coenzyme A thioesterase [Flavobacteriaceae bacterium UJ101]|nr:acyl-coenzyme A thioesterase [Flavobacteriaceae bacterium UJ101]
MTHKTIADSEIEISELMLPSHANFGGKVHGGYILQLMDQIAFACASQFSGSYCVTASVNSVDFLNPIEVGELTTMKASINHVGKSSMVVGIRVESKNIQTGEIKHCNSSYFTMVAVKDGKPVEVPRLKLKSENEVRRFIEAIRRKKAKRDRDELFSNMTIKLEEENITDLEEKYNIKIEL